jgi:hypothetical protein
MEVLQLMLVVVMVLVGSIFGTSLGVLYKVDKLQKSLDDTMVRAAWGRDSV